MVATLLSNAGRDGSVPGWRTTPAPVSSATTRPGPVLFATRARSRRVQRLTRAWRPWPHCGWVELTGSHGAEPIDVESISPPTDQTINRMTLEQRVRDHLDLRRRRRRSRWSRTRCSKVMRLMVWSVGGLIDSTSIGSAPWEPVSSTQPQCGHARHALVKRWTRRLRARVAKNTGPGLVVADETGPVGLPGWFRLGRPPARPTRSPRPTPWRSPGAWTPPGR